MQERGQATDTLGTVTGTVLSDSNEPVQGVTVAVSGVNETATTGNDGKYTVTNVSVETHTVAFSKAGWETVNVTIPASRFNADKIATVNATLRSASAKITGLVLPSNTANAKVRKKLVSFIVLLLLKS